MFKMVRQWRAKMREKRERLALAFLDSKKYDIDVIDAKYADYEGCCMNCRAPLKGPFCRACGQKDDDLRRPIWTFLSDLMDSVFDADNKIFKTLILLVLVPGGLTRAFVNGRRASFSPPLRLYVVVSVLFFLFLSATDLVLMDIKVTTNVPAAVTQTTGPTDTADTKETTASSEQDIKEKTTAEESGAAPILKGNAQKLDKALENLSEEDRKRAEDLISKVDPQKKAINVSGGAVEIGDDLPFDVEVNMFVKPDLENRIGMDKETIDDIINDPDNEEFVKNITKGIEKLLLQPELSNEIFNKWLPRILILIIPIFALFLRMTHWGKQRYYFNQIIFSVHYHTFLFLLMGSLLVIVPLYGGETGTAIFWSSAAIYLFIALKVAQNQGWIRTFFKFIFLWTMYALLLSMGLFAVLTLGLSEI